MLRALEADAREEIAAAMRVGVCASAGLKRAEIAAKLEMSPADVRAAFERLKRAAHRMES